MMSPPARPTGTCTWPAPARPRPPPAPTTITPEIYEPAFAKNTAFNRDFGTAAEEVARGDHSHDAAAIASGVLDATRLPLALGDTGSGGAAGCVPAPAPGDAAAGKFLAADATWRVPAAAGGIGKGAAFPP